MSGLPADLIAPAAPGVRVHLPPIVPEGIMNEFVNRGMYLTGALSFLVWDIILTLPNEIHMYRYRGSSWLITPAFIVARYSGPVCLGLYIHVIRTSTWTTRECFLVGRASIFLGAIITSAASFIFAVRTWAMWRRNSVVLVVVAALWSAQLAANMFLSNWFVPHAVNLGVCVYGMPGHEVPWAYYVSNITYDALITALAFASVLVDSHGPDENVKRTAPGNTKHLSLMNVQKRLMTEGMIYFCCALFVNLLNVLFFSKSWLYANINGSLANAVTAFCAYRLVLLKLGGDVDIKSVLNGSAVGFSRTRLAYGPEVQQDTTSSQVPTHAGVTTDQMGMERTASGKSAHMKKACAEKIASTHHLPIEMEPTATPVMAKRCEKLAISHHMPTEAPTHLQSTTSVGAVPFTVETHVTEDTEGAHGYQADTVTCTRSRSHPSGKFQDEEASVPSDYYHHA